MWAGLVVQVSKFASTLWWVSLTFLLIYLAVTGLCLAAMFKGGFTQKMPTER